MDWCFKMDFGQSYSLKLAALFLANARLPYVCELHHWPMISASLGEIIINQITQILLGVVNYYQW